MTDVIKNGGKRHPDREPAEAPDKEKGAATDVNGIEESTAESLAPEDLAVEQEDKESSGGEGGQINEPEDGNSKKSFYSKKHGDKHSKEKEAAAKLEVEIEAAKAREQELRDRYIRLSADFDNFRKRSQKENEAKYLDAKADTLKQFLPVVDSFERAAAAEPEDGEAKALTEGYRLIYSQLTEILRKNGVEEIKALGEQFNPNLHYAVMHVDDETLGQNTVCEVFEKGYKMGDRILRFSTVKVAN